MKAPLMFPQISKLFINGQAAKRFYLSISIVSLFIFVLAFLYPSIAQTENKGNTKQSDNYFNVINKTGLLRWPKSAMPLNIFIKPGDTTDGFRPIFITLLEQAFSEWAASAQNRIRFELTNDPSKAQIVCDWTSDKNDMTKLTEGGHALVIPDGHNIQRVQITILTKTIGEESLSDQYFKRVALHEIGHSLGITDHSPNPNDMMYGNPPYTTTNCTLTDRDINTLIDLYSLDQETMNHRTINMANMLPDKDNQSNLARIIRLNAEAAKAMQTKNLALAVAKLEEAHNIDPNNELINSNLGSAYGNCAIVASTIHETQRAQIYFNKALPLLDKGPNRENNIAVLKYYENFLRSNNKLAEAEKVERKIKTLSNR
jgi:predicted Zn-dependent protease